MPVVSEDFFDGVLGKEVVLVRRHHTLVEEMRNPLSHVKLVEVVVFNTVLQQTVDQLAHLCHGTALCQLFQLVEWLLLAIWRLKRVDDNIHDQVDDLDLSQELLVLHNGEAFALERIFAVGVDHKEDEAREHVLESFNVG